MTSVGPSWIFDAEARQAWQGEYERAVREAAGASPANHRQRFAEELSHLRLGQAAERVAWAIHASVMADRTSVVTLSDRRLATHVWGTRLPKHWRGVLLRVLESLSWLHVAPASDAGPPSFGAHSVLLTHFADLRRQNSACPASCPFEVQGRHHHLKVEVGPAFLGVLEQFGASDSSGVRHYSFPIAGKKESGATLRKIGKTGSLVPVFLPAKVGIPARCDQLSRAQHRLLQALVRETTREKPKDRALPTDAAAQIGNVVPGFSGPRQVACPQLDPLAKYVGFNGNGKRKGRGYKLTSPGGWLAKAGFPVGQVAEFLDALAGVAEPMKITVVGFSKGGRTYSLPDLVRLTAAPQGRQTLDALHLRAYAPADYLNLWSRWFGVEHEVRGPGGESSNNERLLALQAQMRSKGVSGRGLAACLKEDPSFVSKVLRGAKAPPDGFLDRAAAAINRMRCDRPSTENGSGHGHGHREPGSFFAAASHLVSHGWSIVPQRRGEKKPCIRWKEFQERIPSPKELKSWWATWPNAGLALVLGPVSGVFVVDVDGKEAHDALLRRLGSPPEAPKVISGSGKPYRYHLYFRHPDIETKAKGTPWHPKLEFRGHRGIVIVPPSLHPSGQAYLWEAGRPPSPEELPSLPKEILSALRPPIRVRPRLSSSGKPVPLPAGIDASVLTKKFLSGAFSEGPRWNERLFTAACDLHGRGVPRGVAEPLLLAGAGPWNRGEEQLAQRTIESAYSQPRQPSSR
jgi:hypothetical protein